MSDPIRGVNAGRRPKISVCIVTYNHEKYIADCIASVVAQQVDADLEILVGEDCSPDGTRAIVARFGEQYPGLVIPLLREKNLGAAQNSLTMIAQATGDYIAHLDGDDYWLPGKLQAQLDFLQSHPQCSAAYTNAVVIDDGGTFTARFNRAVQEEFDLEYLIRGGNFLCNSSMLYRRAYLERFLRIEGRFIDYLLHVELAGDAMLGYVNRDLTVYRVNVAASMSVGTPELTADLYWNAIVRAVELGVSAGSLRRCLQGRCRNLLRTALVRRIPGAAWRRYWRMHAEMPGPVSSALLFAVLTLPHYLWRDVLRAWARRLFKGGADVLYDR